MHLSTAPLPFRILRLRSKQLCRAARSGGISALILLPVLTTLLLERIHRLSVVRSPLYLHGLLFIVLLLIDQGRKDGAFLSLLPRNGRAVRMAEYAVVALCFNLLAHHRTLYEWLYLLPDAVWILLLAHLPRRVGTSRLHWARNATARLPLSLYTLKMVLRRHPLLLLLVWLLSLGVCIVVPVAPVFLFAVVLLLGEYLALAEPLEITQSLGSMQRALWRIPAQTALALALGFLPQLLLSLRALGQTELTIVLAVATWTALANLFYAFWLRYQAMTVPVQARSRVVPLLLFLVVSPLVPLSAYLLYRTYKTASCQLRLLLP